MYCHRAHAMLRRMKKGDERQRTAGAEAQRHVEEPRQSVIVFINQARASRRCPRRVPSRPPRACPVAALVDAVLLEGRVQHFGLDHAAVGALVDKRRHGEDRPEGLVGHVHAGKALMERIKLLLTDLPE